MLESKEVVVVGDGMFIYIVGRGLFVHYVFSVETTRRGQLTIREDLHMLHRFSLLKSVKNPNFIYFTGRLLYPPQGKQSKEEWCRFGSR